MLFNIFINDIFYFISDSSLYNYADDNTLSYSGYDLDKIINTLEKDSLKGERNQLMIWSFIEFRTNKKNENITFLMKILQGLMLKHVYILLNLNFPLSMLAAIFLLSMT